MPTPTLTRARREFTLAFIIEVKKYHVKVRARTLTEMVQMS